MKVTVTKGAGETYANLNDLKTMVARAEFAGVPPTAEFKVAVSMGGKIKNITFDWEDTSDA